MSESKEILDLRETIESLEEEKNDLQILFENVNEHNSQLENDLNKLINNMKRYLSPQLYESIVGGSISDSLSYNRKQLTVFFSDIVNFTSITDSTEPEVLSECLNLYMDEMSRVAINHGGTIDKFIGDAIMVFFGDPTTEGTREDATACVSMAMEMQNKIPVLREYWKEKGIPMDLEVRMGINTGYCTVGNFGSTERMDYTIMGGQVNIASRLEHAANPGTVLVSESTWQLIRALFTAEEKPPIEVKGVHHPIKTFEIQDFVEHSDRHTEYFHPLGDGFVMDQLVYDPKNTGEREKAHIRHDLEQALARLDEALEKE